jgi:hypothetical protein
MTFKDTEQSEPTRYRITFYCLPKNISDERYFTYLVCTMLGEPKAIAWATYIHFLTNPRRTVYDVNVELLGKAGPEDDDLNDRMEW